MGMITAAERAAGWNQRWIHRAGKLVKVREFADHELCVAEDYMDFRLFHRRSGWTLRSRISEAEAVRTAEAWAGFDWDFDAETEAAAMATRERVVAWMEAQKQCQA